MNQENGRMRALLERVEASRQERRQRALDEGRQRAEALVARARAEARARVLEATRAERERQRQRLDAARAELLTRTRQLEQGLAANLLGQGWHRIRDELSERWSTAEGRARWCRRVLAKARAVLPPGVWTLYHPASLPEPELRVLARRIRELSGHDPTLETSPEIQAGLRVEVDGARLDATIEGLLVDVNGVEGRLLVELARSIDGSSAKGGTR